MSEQEVLSKQIRITMNLLELSCGVSERTFKAALWRLHYQIRNLIASTDRDGLAITSEDQ